MSSVNNPLVETDTTLRHALWGSGAVLWGWERERDQITLRSPGSEPDQWRVQQESTVHYREQIHIDDRISVMVAWNEHLFGSSERFEVQYRRRCEDRDEWIWVRECGTSVLRDAQGMALQISGITQTFDMAVPDPRNLQLLASAFDNTSEGMCILSADRTVIDANQAFRELFGAQGVRMEGKALQKFISDDVAIEQVQKIFAIVEERGEWQGEFDWREPGSGDTTPTWASIATLTEHGKITHYVIQVIDITDRKQSEEQLWRLANFDALTDLANRSAFQSRLMQAIDDAGRSDESIAVLFVDLDRFKQINDSLGHKAGDDLLKTLARRLKSAIRTSDVAGRWGGDEFVVLLTHIKQEADAWRVANKIRDAVLQPVVLAGVHVTVSASVGVALFPAHAEDGNGLLECADAAMYAAKASGRNEVRIYTRGLNDEADQTLLMEQALGRAIRNQEMELFFQPKINLHDNTIDSAEALLRWHHEDFGEVPAERFVALADESGDLVMLGRWVFDQVCQQLAAWKGTALAHVRLAVNLWSSQMLDPTLVPDLDAMLERYGIDPCLLEVEVTENSLMADVERSTEVIEALRQLGVQVAVDDFGSGWCSLGHLKRLPLNTLKIEREFIADIGRDSRGEAVVQSIVSLARNLRFKVVAEGVESVDQLQKLRDFGCDEVQGFLFAPAMPIEELERRIYRVHRTVVPNSA